MNKQPDVNRDIDFLYEIGCLRYIQRTWKQFLNPDFQNLAEHHLRVIWIALMIAAYEKNVDTAKVMKLALVHDIAESRTGDVNYLQRQYVKRMEEQGLNDMLAGTSLVEEFSELWHEYEQRQSLESRIVKDADILDVEFEIKEQAARGHDFGPGWAEIRDHVTEKELFTESAKQLYRSLRQSHPHEWHNKANNRYRVGDWKK